MHEIIQKEIEALRNEADAAIQAYFSLKTVHELMATEEGLLERMRTAAYFWATVLHSLQCVYFLSIRKFFDPDNRSHRFDKLVKLCESHIDAFSREALAKRREKDFPSRAELKDYVKNAFVPPKGFFEAFKGQIYQELDRLNFRQVYRTITDKVIAHNEVVNPQMIEELFDKTEISEVEQILLLMERISTEFRSLWVNGHKPDLSTTQLPLSRLVIDDVRRAIAGKARKH